ncbi:MAG: PKD domain-containing protein, partial [Bacteroidota bacterium]|nr:PKD domain-containing protein [Bacteroidota bacterium]
MNSTRPVLLFFLFLTSVCLAQKETAHWYFGNEAGLYFTETGPVTLLDGQLNTTEGCATVSDRKGNLLFYTDGVRVWNRFHQIMPNGTGLFGNSSSTQSTLIVPYPRSNTKYLIFTIDKPSYYLTPDDPINGFNYSVIDLALNNGLGDIVPGRKNVHLLTYDTESPLETEYKSSEKITSVVNGDGTGFWVVTQFSNTFLSFLVDENGVNHSPIISTIPTTVLPSINLQGINVSAIGSLKASPDGRKLAIAHSLTTSLESPRSGREENGEVLVYDFDNMSGTVDNEVKILTNSYPYGLEFSPNSTVLYVTTNQYNERDEFTNSTLYQYDMSANNIASSRKIIDESMHTAGALQLALDGKIYRAGFQVSRRGAALSVIRAPDNLGNQCDYAQNIVSLGGKEVMLGLPSFVQSLFVFSFEYEYTCLGEETLFNITTEHSYDSVLWEFGDGTTSSLESPGHTFQVPGPHSVKLSLYKDNNLKGEFFQEVFITEPPGLVSDTYEFVQCDSFGDPNDGRANFNLSSSIPGLLLDKGQNGVQAYFYRTLEALQMDDDNTNALNNFYQSNYNGEELYVKVYAVNSECFDIATISLMTAPPIDLPTFYLETCVTDVDEVALFDLNLAQDDISQYMLLTPDQTIAFYETENQAYMDRNPLGQYYESASKDIYFKIYTENGCLAMGSLALEVTPLPKFEDKTLKVC